MVERLGLPLMLKPDQGGSALGAQVVAEAADLPAAMVSCLAYADTVLAERFVQGTEVAVSVVEDDTEPRALPPVEVEAKGGVYDYTARYTPPTLASLADFLTGGRGPHWRCPLDWGALLELEQMPQPAEEGL